MPRKATGNVYFSAGSWYARVTLDKGKRRSFVLPTCKTEEEAKARLDVLAELAAKLRSAGLVEIAPDILERAAAAKDARGFGGAATVTGIGAAVGVPAMVVSTTLVVGGAGNIAPEHVGREARTKHRHRVRRALLLRVQIELRQLKLNVGRQIDLWQRRRLHLGAGHAR